MGIALAVNSCNDGVCPQPSDQLGNVLYAGPWTPTAHPSSGNYQNFTLQVPEYMPEGPATFTLTHLCLIGVSAHNIADISNSLADGELPFSGRTGSIARVSKCNSYSRIMPLYGIFSSTNFQGRLLYREATRRWRRA